jgi:cytosine/adenosine deaminase-related metal-dependent hydrolase
MSETTWIKNADLAVVWEPEAARHVLARGADVVFTGAEITFVGPGFSGEADTVVDGGGHMVLPGLIDVHSHPSSEPLKKGLTEECGSPLLHMTTLYEYMPLLAIDAEAARAATEVAMCELLKSGCTTMVDLSVPYEGWLDTLGASGMRAYAAPMYRSATWSTPNGHDVVYAWDEAAGERAFATALDVVDRAGKHESALLSGMLAPSQVDTCSPDLLRESARAAAERGLKLQIHAAQSVVEFREMVRRHGQTPIEFLAEHGVLGPDTIVAHAIFLDHHPWLGWPDHGDLRRLAMSGAAVAHAPNVFVRRGMVLHDLARYRAAGITVALGIDTFPHNMIDEMRWAATMAKVATDNVHALTAADVLETATVAGAAALGREDIGRLAPGAKADLVLVDLEHPSMQPLWDPLRSLIFSALERAVSEVYVDGRLVVSEGEVLTLDHRAAASRLGAAQRRALEGVEGRDWAGRTALEAFPPSLLG